MIQVATEMASVGETRMRLVIASEPGLLRGALMIVVVVVVIVLLVGVGGGQGLQGGAIGSVEIAPRLLLAMSKLSLALLHQQMQVQHPVAARISAQRGGA